MPDSAEPKAGGRYTPRRLRKQFLLALAVIVAVSALTTSLFGFREVDALVGAVSGHHLLDVGHSLAQPESGQPQTVLLIGSDRRGGQPPGLGEGQGRSDTMILARLDPDQKVTALWSLPRDLEVSIAGHGDQNKLNSAYSYGGPALTVDTITQLTGLPINHVIDVNFGGFRQAVDQLGCVYTDVDRHYFNDNSGRDQYATINLPAGYQKLCGQQALDYVRYRHTDTDVDRQARQQDFLRQAKQQVGFSGLIFDQSALLNIFANNTSSDISKRSDAVHLMGLALGLAGEPVRQVPFEGTLGPSFVSATPEQMDQMRGNFLGAGQPPQQRAAKSQPKPAPRPVSERPAVPAPPPPPPAASPPPPPDLMDVSTTSRTLATQLGPVSLPIYYPTLVPNGASITTQPRAYDIQAPDGRSYPSYRTVINSGKTGEYYGLQATSWQDPPILKGPSTRRVVGGRSFQVYYSGNKADVVAWRDGPTVYWLSNGLLQTLSERQMLAMASTCARL